MPLRGVFESLGAEVSWNGETRSVIAVKNNTVVELQIGNPTATVNGDPVTIDVPPELREGRTFVPLRFISESLGAVVDWEPETYTVIISGQ